MPKQGLIESDLTWDTKTHGPGKEVKNSWANAPIETLEMLSTKF